MIPTLLSNLNGSLAAQDRSGAITLTGSGALRWRPLPSGAGRTGALLEAAATNAVPNPWFALGTTGWSAANGTLTRDTAWAYEGPASGRLTASTAAAAATVALTLTADTYTVQAVIRNESGAARTVKLTYNGADVAITSLPNDWLTFAAPSAILNGDGTATIAAGRTATIAGQISGAASAEDASIVVLDSVAGDVIRIGYLGIVAEIRPTSPCPEIDGTGALVSGYSWAGTAHNSSSTRSAAQISFLRSSFNRGGSFGLVLRTWLTPSAYPGSGNPLNYLVAGWGSANWPSMPAVGVIGATAAQSWVCVTLSTGLYIDTPPNQLATIGLSYSAATMAGTVYLDGVAQGSATLPNGFAWPSDFSGATTEQASLTGNQLISGLALYDASLTAVQQAQLSARTAPWTWGMLMSQLSGIMRVGGSSPFGVNRAAGPSPVGILRVGES